MAKLYTKAQIILDRPIDEVFQSALEACEKLKANVKSVDETGYHIVAKTRHHGFTHSRLKFNIEIFLTEEEGRTLLEIYDDYITFPPGNPDTNFMQEFFNALNERVTLTSNYSLEVTQEIRPGGARNIHVVCTNCGKNIYSFNFRMERLCTLCFQLKYGSILMRGAGEYYGGHKAYLAGGVISDKQIGSIFLTEHHLIFMKDDKDPTKKWEVIIPLASVVIDRWRVEEVTRRSQITGGAIGSGDAAFGTGFIHDSGKAHHIVVPYIDQNGIPQEPRFGVSSLGGKAIREWSAQIYEKIVEEKKGNKSEQTSTERRTKHQGIFASLPTPEGEERHHPTQNPVSQTNTSPPGDPIGVLKMRLAKGEITKQEYEELRQLLES